MATASSAEVPRHTIRVVARRTGLTAATLRAWERRYGAVRPARSGTERRLYSDADIERLAQMRDLVKRGHGLTQLARLSAPDLAALVRDERAHGASESARALPGGADSESTELVAVGERAIAALDGVELHRLLTRAMIELGPTRFIDAIVSPLCRRVGVRCNDGSLTVAHEHVASVAMRQVLSTLLDALRVSDPTAPAMVATTPSGERHEFGAMMAAAIASTVGWRAIYLGPDLPTEALAAAVRQSSARVIALSVIASVYTEPALADLRALRQLIGPNVEILVGGSSAPRDAAALSEKGGGARHIADLAELRAELESLARRI
jgi:methanogenic corrinoid protein MtbC1